MCSADRFSLALDLVISILHMPKVGYFYTDSLYQRMGKINIYNHRKGCNWPELYIHLKVQLHAAKKVVLQIRSPFIKNKYSLFLVKYCCSGWRTVDFPKLFSFQVGMVIHECSDQQFRGTSLWYLISPAVKKTMGDALVR